MFERRLKIFLGIICGITFLLVLRAGQVQVAERERWRKAAAETMKRSQLVDTVRGSLLDCRGRVIAFDEACIDACVDYRAILDPPDEKWVSERALERLRNDPLGAYAKSTRAARKDLLRREEEAVRADIKRMWAKLAEFSRQNPELVAEARSAIVHRVEMRRRLIWYRNYQKAQAKQEQTAEQESFWRKWLAEDGNEAPPLDNFSVIVAEQTDPHVILRAIDVDAQNELGKHIDQYPGLVLRPSTHRKYPFAAAGCHLLGRVSQVMREDIDKDPEAASDVRQYLPNDQIGRGGVEALCERALRGSKGKVERVVGEDGIATRIDPVPGRDVSLSIDIELQGKIENIFADAELIDNDNKVERALLHGAAVIIDVRTGEVRALASFPTFDPNTFDEQYKALRDDRINQPLLNRATMSQLQPGSTVKPMVGLGAITQGLSAAQEGIECTGYLMIGGRKQGVGRCWVASKFSEVLNGAVAHHPVPWDAPHPTGFLTFADALERSCNVYFETLADRLGLEGLSTWMERFGLGRMTGIGIAEFRGRLPRDYRGPAWDRKYKTWFSGIGQDPVSATPLQMANVAATIARGGLWMRPRLIADAEARAAGITLPELRPTTRPGDPPGTPGTPWPDQFDLHLSPEAVAAAREGMFRVVNGKAGTGKQLLKNSTKLAGMLICGKTGTAQAGRFSIRLIDQVTGKPLLDENGKPRFRFLEPSTPQRPNPEAPWFRGNGPDGQDLSHAWYIGFAPADRPQIAFAVMVEYGGSGGHAAGAVAKKAIEACIDHGYLAPAGGATAAGRTE